MAEFVRAQIFGTTFEITSRYAYEFGNWCWDSPIDCRSDTQICNPWAWERLVLFGNRSHTLDSEIKSLIDSHSSAKDQLTQQPVAVKKIMKPFSTPVLSKRTYRELKLLKHLRHENVG
jgi:p38 MAP kinase